MQISKRVTMKRHTIILSMILFGSYGSYWAVVEPPYKIAVKTVGEDRIVHAIQQYSNLTTSDVNRWTFSAVPFVGQYIRNEMREKIRSFVRVCRSIVFANKWFDSGNELIRAVPANWKLNAICLALENLELQGDCALALLAKIGISTIEEQEWYDAINGKNDEFGRPVQYGYLKIIEGNKGLLGTQCQIIKQIKADEKKTELQIAHDTLAANKLYWEDKRLKWKMARDVSSGVFNATKWAVQSAYTMSIEQPGISLASAAAAYYFWNRLFGLPAKR